tara:strand:+ start:64735 stop:65439 length:705 start_codon:yes stop_codon:yes gene_type:complete
MGFLTGDIVDIPTIKKWDYVDDSIDSLQLPVYLVAGNHDMYNRPLFESRYGRPYFQFSFKNDLFIVIDANESGWSITGNQLQFLKNTLDSDVTVGGNIFVFFHQVLWRTDNNDFRHVLSNSNEGRQLPLNFWSEIAPLFTSLPNEVNMFAGDVGCSWASKISMDRYKNLNFISSGMCGTSEDNFLIVEVDSAKNVDYEIICLNDSNISCLGSLESYIMVDSDDTPLFRIYPNPT